MKNNILNVESVKHKYVDFLRTNIKCATTNIKPLKHSSLDDSKSYFLSIYGQMPHLKTKSPYKHNMLLNFLTNVPVLTVPDPGMDMSFKGNFSGYRGINISLLGLYLFYKDMDQKILNDAQRKYVLQFLDLIEIVTQNKTVNFYELVELIDNDSDLLEKINLEDKNDLFKVPEVENYGNGHGDDYLKIVHDVLSGTVAHVMQSYDYNDLDLSKMKILIYCDEPFLKPTKTLQYNYKAIVLDFDNTSEHKKSGYTTYGNMYLRPMFIFDTSTVFVYEYDCDDFEFTKENISVLNELFYELQKLNIKNHHDAFTTHSAVNVTTYLYGGSHILDDIKDVKKKFRKYNCTFKIKNRYHRNQEYRFELKLRNVYYYRMPEEGIIPALNYLEKIVRYYDRKGIFDSDHVRIQFNCLKYCLSHYSNNISTMLKCYDAKALYEFIEQVRLGKKSLSNFIMKGGPLNIHTNDPSIYKFINLLGSRDMCVESLNANYMHVSDIKESLNE